MDRFSALIMVGLLLPGATLAQGKPQFVRGDANTDQQVDIGDPVSILLNMFGGEPLRCMEGADANADTEINLSDPVYLLEFLFRDAASPPAPYPLCDEPILELAFGCEETPCPGRICSIEAHGCVIEGVECPVFRTDSGQILELNGRGDLRSPPIGWCGTITAEPCKGCASFCQQGQIVILCDLDPDKQGPCPLTFHGRAIEGVECVVFRSDEGKTYELFGGPPEVRKVGWSGTVNAKPRPDLGSFCMQGAIVEVCSAVPDSPSTR